MTLREETPWPGSKPRRGAQALRISCFSENPEVLVVRRLEGGPGLEPVEPRLNREQVGILLGRFQHLDGIDLDRLRDERTGFLRSFLDTGVAGEVVEDQPVPRVVAQGLAKDGLRGLDRPCATLRINPVCLYGYIHQPHGVAE